MNHRRKKQSTGSSKHNRDMHQKVQKPGKARLKDTWVKRGGKRNRPVKDRNR